MTTMTSILPFSNDESKWPLCKVSLTKGVRKKKRNSFHNDKIVRTMESDFHQHNHLKTNGLKRQAWSYNVQESSSWMSRVISHNRAITGVYDLAAVNRMKAKNYNLILSLIVRPPWCYRRGSNRALFSGWDLSLFFSFKKIP